MLDELGAVDPIYLSTAKKQVAMVQLARERARLESVEMRILAVSDDVARGERSRLSRCVAHSRRRTL